MALPVTFMAAAPGVVPGSSPAEAAAALEAQQRLRSQEQERALREQLEPQPDAQRQASVLDPDFSAAKQGPLPVDETPCFVINKIILEGDAAEQFQWALPYANPGHDPALGHCLGTQGINMVMARLQHALIDRGFVTSRVLVSPQKLDQGILTLQLIPGRVRAIRFADGVTHRATLAILKSAVPIQPGDLLNLHDIAQAQENFKRVPTAEIDIQITPATGAQAKLGESDLIIQWQQTRGFRLSAFADDSGTQSTGKYQGGVTLSFDHLLTLNDLFYITLNHDLGGGQAGDRGTRGNMLHYSVPYAYWLLSLTASSYHYHQTLPGYFRVLVRYSGESDNSEIRLARVLHRNGQRKTTAAVRLWSRNSRNFVNNTATENQQRRMAGWELSLHQRELIAAAILDVTLTYYRGTGVLNTLPAPEELFNEGTSRPQILSAQTQLTLPFQLGQQKLRYNLMARAQWNQTPLIPQDRFAIGGRYTVRGFDGESSLLAERGYLVRNDLTVNLGHSGQELYLGLDYGDIDGPSSQFQIGKRLIGGVLGLRGSFKKR